MSEGGLMTAGRSAPVDGDVAVTPPRSTKRLWLAFSGCLLGLFMQMLDTTVVNIALPDLTVEMQASSAQQLLVLSVYTLAFACTLLSAATIGGIFGRRRLFLFSLVAFTAASILCGLAQSPVELIVFRGLQGIGAALMSAQTLALIAALFPKSQHGRVFGIYGAVAGVAAMLGPVIGGLLVDADLFGWGWRTILFVNVPIGAAAFVFAAGRLPQIRDQSPGTVDKVGVGLSAVGLFALLYPLSVGREQDWPPRLWAMMGAAAVMLVVFVVYERRLLLRGGAPVLRVDLFATRQFSVGLMLSLAFFSVFAGFFFSVSVSAQFGLGFSALKTGLLSLPLATGAVVGTLASAGAVTRIGQARTLAVGALLVAGGFAWLATVLDPGSAALSIGAIVAPLMISGLGIGLFVAPLQTSILSGTSPDNVGSASGCVPTVQQIGASIGLTLIGVFFFAAVGAHAKPAVDAARPALAASLQHSDVDPMFAPIIADRFSRCATAQLTSPHPERPAHGCSASGATDSTAGRIAAQAAPELHAAGRQVAAISFLGAFRTTLWGLSALAVAVGAASLALGPVRRDDPQP